MKCLHSLNSVCPAENNNNYNWIATEAGRTRRLACYCDEGILNFQGTFAYRLCTASGNWESVDNRACQSQARKRICEVRSTTVFFYNCFVISIDNLLFLDVIGWHGPIYSAG